VRLRRHSPRRRLGLRARLTLTYALGAALLSSGDPRHIVHAFPWVQSGSLTNTGSDRRFYGFNHLVRLYVDGPATLQFDADGAAGGIGDPSGGYSVSGFLEALPPA